MKKRVSWITAFMLIINAGKIDAQGQSLHADTIKVNELIQSSREVIGTSPDKAIIYGMQAKELAERTGFKKGLALSLKSIGMAHYYQSQYVEAIEYWRQSLDVFEAMQDKVGVANLLNNIGAIYFDQAEDAKALEYYFRSLKISEEIGDKLRISTALTNIGGVYFNKKATYDKALYYFLKAYPLAKQVGDEKAISTISVNIGEVYYKLDKDSLALVYFNSALKGEGNAESIPYIYNCMGKLYFKKGQYDKALEYHEKALQSAEKFNGQLDIVQALTGIGNTYLTTTAYSKALPAFLKAASIAEGIEALKELEPIYDGIARTYRQLGKSGDAYVYRSKYASIKDSLYNIGITKKLALQEYSHNLEKKESEISLLTKEKTLADLELRRQQQARIALTIGLALILLIVAILWRTYRTKVKTTKVLDHQKNMIEGLLLNILPTPVARELQEKGQATPRYYESVSVLFTDFKSFTSLTDKLSPRDVVDELNICFMAFDDIIEKHNLEKIKTIGDSYMCAGGIPSPHPDHIYSMIRASLEIQSWIGNYNRERESRGLPRWELRIGIHVGPVVAGVVGKKKYAYDIWGSTVNIASRMESNGIPGRVNISAATYEQVKDQFVCTPRGKIHAKNVGEIDMYFIEGRVSEMETIPPQVLPEKTGQVPNDAGLELYQ